MCRPTTCRACGLTTWSGCGAHVAQVRAQVPADEWCQGHPEQPPRRSLIARLLDREADR